MKDIKILVAGDIMLDHYIQGDVNRISPEAPVPVVLVRDDDFRLGGCGNLISNLVELGVKTSCITSFGQDDAGLFIGHELNNILCPVINMPSDKITTQKIRIIGGDAQTQMLRIDREDKSPIECLCNIESDADIIIVSDYGKGVVTRSLMDKLHALNKPIIVDPVPENFYTYGKAFLITPNKKEWQKTIFNNYDNFENALITMGKDGVKLIQRDCPDVTIAALSVKIFNVSGAGDTIVAIMAVCYAMGIDLEKSARIANDCAGYVVTQPGTSTVPRQLFLEVLSRYGA